MMPRAANSSCMRWRTAVSAKGLASQRKLA
jgi:hypothetical protein